MFLTSRFQTLEASKNIVVTELHIIFILYKYIKKTTKENLKDCRTSISTKKLYLDCQKPMMKIIGNKLYYMLNYDSNEVNLRFSLTFIGNIFISHCTK